MYPYHCLRCRACVSLGIFLQLLKFINVGSFNLNHHLAHQHFHFARPNQHHVKELRGMLKGGLDVDVDVKANDNALVPVNNHSFSFSWAEQRSEEEIVTFCATTLFPEMDADIARKKIKVISTDLPLVEIEYMISNEMGEEIIQAAQTHGKMRRSTVPVGDSQEKADIRTSSTIYLAP